jgi:transglutaminase-like putative cysteine protease/tetratricopeptide (TPR) repeat protein
LNDLWKGVDAMPRGLSRWLMGLGTGACFIGAAGVCADDSGGWKLPRLTAEGNQVNEAAARVSVKAGTDVVVLDEEESYVFDESGKSVYTHYFVYKVVTQGGVEGWDAVSLNWEPWHQERPSVRARVVTPDNAVHPLDPKTITDAPARDEDDKTYGDGRVLRAPLPAMAPGSIVEEEAVFKDSAPFFGAGVVERNYFGRYVPVQQSKLILDAPASLPLRYSQQLLPEMKPQKTESNGRVQILFESGAIEALDEIESYLPKDVTAQPVVTFSTGTSWQEIAKGYAKIVDEKARVNEVQALVTKLVSGKTAREEKAAAIVQYLSREIRYTGVEFGDAAIIPHAPSETLKHKYGDCKDKATLAVAMLRAADVPAYVALLNVGSRYDVDAELPGMGMFDHAIVYGPGSPDLWIDATDEYARLGQLPQADQGRLALVARPESTSLTTIPEASSQENRIVEKREFYLAENGPARVVETTEPRGVFESGYRSAYVDADNKDRRKNLKDYIADEYLSEILKRMERSEPADLGRPFQLVIEADKAKRGATDLESALAAIRLESLFSRLPNELQRREKEEDKGADPAKDKPKKPRTGDFQLPEAFSYEWRYRIVPPLGFQAKPLPPNAKNSLGPATLTEEFAMENDGAVRATFRFDTVKRRITAAEAKELTEKLLQIREGPAIFVYFEPTAQALMNQGKMKEAFQATRNVIAQHPKEAVHHLQRAKMLLAGGMGQAAREEARTAVKLEPSSALAQKTLAEILEYDLVGRQYQLGSDHAGAEAAFRTAEKLDPEDHEVVGNLAILLEYNQEGERYGPGAKLKESVVEYQRLREEQLEKIGLKNNLAYALFYAGDFAAAKKGAEKLNPQLNAVIVACETALNGVNAGMTEAQKRTGNEEDLKAVLKTAGEMLMRARKYAPAAELMAAGAEGANASNTMTLAAMLRKAQIHEEMKPEDSPAGVVMKMFLNLADPEITPEKMMAIYSRNGQRVMRDTDPEEVERVLHEGRIMRNALKRTGFPADIMIDVVFPAMQGQVEGDDNSGYRVTLRPAGSNKITMWVIREEGHYKILDGAEKPNSVGLEILDRLAAGNLAGARILLDWVRDEQHLAGGDDPLAGAAFPRMWTKGKEATAEQMKNAAAAILAQTKPTAREGVKFLEASRREAKSEADKVNLSLALLSGYSNLEESEESYLLASELAKQNPESKRLFFDREIALRGLHRYAEADALAMEMAKRLPDDADMKRALIYTAAARGDYAAAHEVARKLVEEGKAEGQDLNNVAWYALFTGSVEQGDLEAATKSAQMTQNSNAGILHTLGCVYAEMGKTKEAREVLVQAMGLLGMDELDANYWYGFGRIAEQYGESDIAKADYEQAKKPKNVLQVPGSSYALAQKRLSVMGNAK